MARNSLLLLGLVVLTNSYPNRNNDRKYNDMIDKLIRALDTLEDFNEEENEDITMEEPKKEKKGSADTVGSSVHLKKSSDGQIGGSVHLKKSSDTLLSETGHGGQILERQNPPPDSDLTNLIESFYDEENGTLVEDKGIHPEMKSKILGDDLDQHRYTYKQMVELGLISEVENDKRNFLKSDSWLWPKRIIPYTIRKGDFTTKHISIIKKGIEEFHTKTCLQWVPKSTAVSKRVGHGSYVEFINERGCWSYVGKAFPRNQSISLQIPGCVNVATVVHEMCHAIGQFHEQSRNDRDKYIRLFWRNIKGGRKNGNMIKEVTKDNNPYDAESVLQYGLFLFSTNGRRTMNFKDKKLNFLADTATGLGFYDVQDITDTYSCTENCKSLPSCQNGGFVNFQCVCVCPDGLTGLTCEKISDNCGSIINLSPDKVQRITSPNYPGKYTSGTKCTWLLKAPNGLYPRITIKELKFPRKDGRCKHWLEVKYNLPGQTGPRLCKTKKNDNWTSSMDSGGVMILRFDSAFASDVAPGKGFDIEAKAVGNGCRGNPCKYGKCVEDENDGSYTCVCQQGFTGINCNQVNGNVKLLCNFENRRCFLDNVQNDNFDWKIRSGRTPTNGTGPTKSRSGKNYLYIETSIPRKRNDVAIYESTVTFQNVHTCLIFWYHMYGKSVGTLKVTSYSTSSGTVSLFTKSGNQGNRWRKATVDVPAQVGQKIKFEGIRGKSFTGDIAIDDVKLVTGKCATRK